MKLNRIFSLTLMTASLALIMASCGISNKVTKPETLSSDINGLSKNELINVVNSKRGEWTSLKATLNADIKYGRKDMSSKVDFSMVKGKGIRMIIIPFPFIELSRLWFTREGITVTDGINKRYAEASYKELSDNLGFPVNYDVLESLFLGYISNPGFTPDTPLTKIFSLEHPVGIPTLTYKKGSVDIAYAINTQGLVQSLTATDTKNRGKATWKYTDYICESGTINFPSTQEINVNLSGRNPGDIKMSFSRFNWNKVEESVVEPNVKSGYQKISLNDLKQMIKKVAK
ncbi:DUF4292 domain-containing protein [Porphyromonas pogonae]|uniref:DUF4292 domain-containing protein n=1 Tax=Porphyromonas pogonae TaxID=867595 RepID=UPI002E759D35|nr:DUF4292 domain-containing protein [Porphyromonas pogonae]